MNYTGYHFFHLHVPRRVYVGEEGCPKDFSPAKLYDCYSLVTNCCLATRNTTLTNKERKPASPALHIDWPLAAHNTITMEKDDDKKKRLHYGTNILHDVVGALAKLKHGDSGDADADQRLKDDGGVGGVPKSRLSRATSEPNNISSSQTEMKGITDDEITVDDLVGSSGGKHNVMESQTGIIFHKSYAFAAVYWRHRALPENGQFRISKTTIEFEGIVGTRIMLPLDTPGLKVEKASRMGGLVKDAFQVVVNSQEGETTYLFTTVLKKRGEVVDKIQAVLGAAKEGHVSKDGTKQKAPLFRMPAEPKLQQMTIIGKQKIKGISINDYYEVAWSEGENCNKKQIYAPFLTSCGKNDVKVTPWEMGGEIVGDWCGEKYTQQRYVTFNFMKQTIGQTLVEVKHTQRCRRLGNDRCIVQMTLEMKGFPYSDCFVVEVRHVASRVGESDIIVEIGMIVRFLKSCLFEGKIKTNTGAETTKAQLELLRQTVEACKPFVKEAAPGEDGEEDDEMDESVAAGDNVVGRSPIILPEAVVAVVRMILMVLLTLFRTYVKPFIQPELLNPLPPSSIDEALQDVRTRLDLLENVTLKSVSGKSKQVISRELTSIKQALDRIEDVSNSGKPSITVHETST